MKYGPDQIARALEIVRAGSMSKKAVAKYFGTSRTTLPDKLAGRAQRLVDKKVGSQF